MSTEEERDCDGLLFDTDVLSKYINLKIYNNKFFFYHIYTLI